MLSISDIQSVLNPLTQRFYKNSNKSLADIYDVIFKLEKEHVDYTAKDILKKYTRSREAFENVMAFPKVKDASCLLTDAPNIVDAKQLEELGIDVVAKEE